MNRIGRASGNRGGSSFKVSKYKTVPAMSKAAAKRVVARLEKRATLDLHFGTARMPSTGQTPAMKALQRRAEKGFARVQTIKRVRPQEPFGAKLGRGRTKLPTKGSGYGYKY